MKGTKLLFLHQPLFLIKIQFYYGKGIPVEIPLKPSNGFQIDLDEVKNKITDKTKMIIINNPNNPTGAVYSKETLEKLCQIARKIISIF